MKGYLLRAENVAQRSKPKGKPLIKLVGAGRFELPTPCSRSKCATRLRYAPPDLKAHRRHVGRRQQALYSPRPGPEQAMAQTPTATRCGGRRSSQAPQRALLLGSHREHRRRQIMASRLERVSL